MLRPISKEKDDEPAASTGNPVDGNPARTRCIESSDKLERKRRSGALQRKVKK
jgi:hypothetical protein